MTDPIRPALRGRALLALACATIACRGTDRAPDPGTDRAVVSVVDSILPREEMLRRFTADLPRPTALEGGAPTRDALVASYVKALAAADTAAIRAITVTKAEFAWLYYPTTPQGLPPYDLTPQMLWFLTEGNGTKGLVRALRRYGGRPLDVAGYRCDPTPSREGENRVWGPCVLDVRAPGGKTLEVRLFSQILERGGRFKILNHGNKL
ncbi:MAG: hypothetical protein NW201_04015 [Gemmatimonadales bacterium]|nr:hypothetical protein [Gemmatimonadales bacterium]